MRNAGEKNQCRELKAATSNATRSVARNKALVENCGIRSPETIGIPIFEERLKPTVILSDEDVLYGRSIHL
jgi:hypothetical protein